MNYRPVPFIAEVIDVVPEFPFTFHVKGSPDYCQRQGIWATFLRVVLNYDGQVLLNKESFEWLQLATDNSLDRERVLFLDGDLPKLHWMTNDWTPKLLAKDG